MVGLIVDSHRQRELLHLESGIVLRTVCAEDAERGPCISKKDSALAVVTLVQKCDISITVKVISEELLESAACHT